MVFNSKMINWLQKRVGQKILLDHHIVLNHKSFAWSVIFPSLQLRYCNLIEYINYLWGAGISTYHFILVNWYNHIFYSNIQIITVNFIGNGIRHLIWYDRLQEYCNDYVISKIKCYFKDNIYRAILWKEATKGKGCLVTITTDQIPRVAWILNKQM